MFSPVSQGIFKKKTSSIPVANNVEKNNLDIQQLTLGPMTNNDSDNSDTVSNLDLIDDEVFPEFFVIINDAILVGYSKNERT